MNKQQDLLPQPCIRCGRRPVRPSGPGLCAPCLYVVIEFLGGRLVRPLMRTFFRKETLVEVQEGVDESMTVSLAGLQKAMHEAFLQRGRIATTMTEQEVIERYGHGKAEQEFIKEEQERSEKRRAGFHPIQLFTWDMLILIAERRFWRRYLLRRFRFDVRRVHRLRGAAPIETIHEQHLFERAITLFSLADAKFSCGLDAIINNDNKGPSTAISTAVEAMSKAESLSQLNSLMMGMDKSASDFIREPAAVDLAAWADTKVKRRPGRKKGSIKDFTASVRLGTANYLEATPSESLVADKGTNPLVEYIGKELEGDVEAKKIADLTNKPRVIEVDDPNSNEQVPGIMDFQMREEVRLDLNKHIARAGLTPRESEVIEFLLQFPDATDEDIAQHLNIDLNNARVTKSHARKKLRAADRNK